MAGGLLLLLIPLAIFAKGLVGKNTKEEEVGGREEKKVFVAGERSGGKEKRRKPWEKERNVPFSSSKKHY